MLGVNSDYICSYITYTIHNMLYTVLYMSYMYVYIFNDQNKIILICLSRFCKKVTNYHERKEMILLKGSSRIVLKARESPVYTCMTLLYNSE